MIVVLVAFIFIVLEYCVSLCYFLHIIINNACYIAMRHIYIYLIY